MPVRIRLATVGHSARARARYVTPTEVRRIDFDSERTDLDLRRACTRERLLRRAAPPPPALIEHAAACGSDLWSRGRLAAHAFWEGLVHRDLVPVAWLDDDARRFRRVRRRRRVPRTCWDALAFAAIAREMVTA